MTDQGPAGYQSLREAAERHGIQDLFAEHKCLAPPCDQLCEPGEVACVAHWPMLPPRIKDVVYQADASSKSSEVAAAALAVVRWFEENLCPDERGRRYNMRIPRPPLAATKIDVPLPPDDGDD